MVKCKCHSEFKCYHNGHCGLFDCSSGNVTCCGAHSNPFGFMMARRVGVILVPIFNKHILRRGR
jgi:hypothetical protein